MTAVIQPKELGTGNEEAMTNGTNRRTHELLANLDAAKKQKIQNEKLRNMVLDTEELAHKVHTQTSSAKQRAELDRLHNKAEEMIRDYKQKLSYSHLRKFNISRYMTSCAQEMQVRDLMNPDDTCDAAPLSAFKQEFGAMRKSYKGTAFSEVMEQGTGILEKATTLLEDSKLKSADWADLAKPVLNLLKEVMEKPGIRTSLTELEEQCRRVQFEIEELSEQQQAAVESGEMSETESLYYRRITMQEGLSDLITKKFEAVNDMTGDVFAQPLRQVHEVHSVANNTIHKLLQEKESLKKRCEKDLTSLNSEIERVNLEDYNSTKASDNAVERLQGLFKENLLKQSSCWAEIEKQEKALVGLSGDRVELAKTLIKTFEQEEKRKVEYQHFTQFTMQHKALLEVTIHNCELAEEITDSVDELISAHCNAIERKMRETEREVEDLQLEVHQDYLEHFRSMYLTIGDLQYKKEANITALDEKIQVAHMQQEMHMESLNPKAREYSQMKKDLAKTKEELEKQVDVLKEKSVQYIEAFKPTERALIEAGRPFEHPVDTLSKMNETRKHKLIAYQQLVSGEGGESELENEKRMIEQLQIPNGSS